MRDWQERGEVLDSDDDNEDSLRTWPFKELSTNTSRHVSPQKPRHHDLQHSPSVDQENTNLESEGSDEEDAQLEAFRKALTAAHAKRNILSKPQLLTPQIVQDSTALDVDRRPDDNECEDAATKQSSALHDTLQYEACGSSTRSSSPLSELSAHTPEFSQLDFDRLVTGRFSSTSDPPVETSLDAEHRRLLEELRAAASHDVVRRRNLRERTTRQLHPFLEERARYLELCRSRGMKPVRILDGTGKQQQREDDSQEVEQASVAFSVETQQQAQRSFELSLPSSRSSVSMSELAVDAHHNDSYALHPPTVQEDFDHQNTYRIQSGNKRRKLEHTRSAAGKLKRPQAYAREPHSLPSPSPSPDSSGPTAAPIPAAGPARFRIPPGLTPAQSLPTPEVSSEVRHAVDRTYSNTPVFSTSKSSQSRAAIIVPSSDSGTETEPESVADAHVPRRPQDVHLLRERKQIRGVLPASWLRIDMRKQGSGFTRTYKQPPAKFRRLHAEQGETEASPLKGVARRRQPGDPRAQPNSTFLSDSELDSDSQKSNGPILDLVQQRLNFDTAADPFVIHDAPDVDDMEHDWIDPLGNTTRLPGTAGKPRKKRQPLIHEAFSNTGLRLPAGERRAEQPMSALTQRAPRAKQHIRKKQPKQSRIPHLSILDVSERSNALRVEPQFVRIAKRRAQRIGERARHSPTRKIVRLQTASDTADAIQTLRAWRSGSMQPQRSVASRKAYHTAHRPTSQQAPIHAHQSRLPNYAPGHEAINPSETVSHTARPKLVRAHRRPAIRDAQLEVLGRQEAYHDRADLFAQRLKALTATIPVIPSTASVHTKPVVTTTHSALTSWPEETDVTSLHPPGVPNQVVRVIHKQSSTSRHRKRAVQRIIVEDAQDLQYIPAVLSPIEDSSDAHVYSNLPRDVLTNIQPLHQPYAIDFGAQALSPGTYFDSNTFVGSGGLATAIKLGDRDLSIAAGRISVHFNDQIFEWSAWTEEVRSDMTTIRLAIRAMLGGAEGGPMPIAEPSIDTAAKTCIEYLVRSMVQYCAHCLYFHDSIDRKDFVPALLEFCSVLMDCRSRTMEMRLLPWVAVLAAQGSKIVRHSSLPADIREKATRNAENVCRHMLSKVIDHHLPDLQAYWIDTAGRRRLVAVQDDHSPVSLVVHAHVIIQEVGISSFWELFDQAVMHNQEMMRDVTHHEQIWRAIFALLPALSLDSRGCIPEHSKSRSSISDWTTPQRLLREVLHLYDATSVIPGTAINQYIRVLLHRSHRLVADWGWLKCETWLATVFDFFTKRGLGILRGETASGSPGFLEDLATQPNLQPSSGDCSYHLFLKTLTVAFKNLRTQSLYSDKKISSLLWRFVPSHGRTHSKETDLKQEDLDALRNHYDLLCILYYVSPPNHRLKINLLQDLICYTDSHRAACRISIRAWTYLASFQASRDEPSAMLEQLLIWFKSIADSASMQYRLARQEADTDYLKAQAEGTCYVSINEVEAIVISNQRQISSTLVDLLVGFKSVISHALNAETASNMVKLCQYWKLFSEVDVSDTNLRAVIFEGLEVIRVCLTKARAFSKQAVKSSNAEDSQEFGDTTALEELAAALDSTHSPAEQDLVDEHQQPLMQVLSNAFGAESPPDDTILATCVELWVDITDLAVGKNRKSWRDILEGYTGSWHQLRDTKQRRLFTPYLLSKIIDKADQVDLPRTRILSDWLVSLAERESSLKWQHELTAALLNRWRDEPLVYNAPFARNARDNVYTISLTDIRQRRLATIASALHNMRGDYYASGTVGPTVQRERRSLYAAVLQSLMTAMKDNYRAICSASDEQNANATAQGNYVNFVHDVVTMLQEYVTDICTIDKFFTDSAAFPLPTQDPTYVVGRLRSFLPRLCETRAQKELVVFLHTTLMRGVAAGKEQYMINQIVTATTISMPGTAEVLPLRCFLLGIILPTYLRSFSSPLVSSLALPLLCAAEAMLSASVNDMPINNEIELQTVSVAICRLLLTSAKLITCHIGRKTWTLEAHRVVVRALAACRSSLPVMQWLMRHLTTSSMAAACLQAFRERCELLAEHCRLKAGILIGMSLCSEPLESDPVSLFDTVGGELDDLPDMPESDLAGPGLQAFLDNHITECMVQDRKTIPDLSSDEIPQADHLEDMIVALQDCCSAFNAIFGKEGSLRCHAALPLLASLQI